MFAPRGTALVWASADNWARLRPTVPTFSDWESYNAWAENRDPKTPSNAARMCPGGFHAFEHQWAMAAAFQMHQTMGRPRVAARIASLNDQLKKNLAQNRKIKIHTPMSADLSAGLVAFEIDGMKTGGRGQAPARAQASSPAAVRMPSATARLAPSLVNTPEEVDRAARAVHEIAA